MTITYLSDQPEEYKVMRKPFAFPPKRSASGYGRKIRTEIVVQMRGNLHRVYAVCWSNCASHWISIGGKVFHLSEADMDGV